MPLSPEFFSLTEKCSLDSFVLFYLIAIDNLKLINLNYDPSNEIFLENITIKINNKFEYLLILTLLETFSFYFQIALKTTSHITLVKKI